MTLYTRGQIKLKALSRLGINLGTSGLDYPPEIDDYVTKAADDIARDTWCFAGAASQDVTQGLAYYASPQILGEYSAFIVDSSFNTRILQSCPIQYLDTYVPQWRTEPTGTPRYIASIGSNKFSLYPTPDTTSLVFSYTDLVIQTNNTQVTSAGQRPFVATDANYILRVPGGNGFVQGEYVIQSVSSGGVAQLNSPIGTATSTSGVATLTLGGLTIGAFMVPGDIWPLVTQTCPLPERAHETVIDGVAKMCAEWYSTPEALARLSFLTNNYNMGVGRLEREMHNNSPAFRFGDAYRFPFGGGFF